mgnify:CR=1 FL=1
MLEGLLPTGALRVLGDDVGVGAETGAEPVVLTLIPTAGVTADGCGGGGVLDAASASIRQDASTFDKGSAPLRLAISRQTSTRWRTVMMMEWDDDDDEGY